MSGEKRLNLDVMLGETKRKQLQTSDQTLAKEYQLPHPLEGMYCREHFDWMLEKFTVCTEAQMNSTFAVMANRTVSCLEDAKGFLPDEKR